MLSGFEEVGYKLRSELLRSFNGVGRKAVTLHLSNSFESSNKSLANDSVENIL